ncbi:PaaI family thioesterase [Caldimonas brevitalea]|uniref:Medium/long-chain acyl-CoA thioesterase YigI n=1 Tax=Caldimonas brevitalea TaxID=413882 RepID=A0A0G3BIQ7_9BURK|nr:PaaI family thioesterase [Caldimonas brevitalea]AKJ29304.1 phenylacetic acid degradation protein [Caldimonas brevitalea]
MQFPVHIPFVKALGFELVRIDDCEAELRVELREEHFNSFGVAHGGISMTLLDVAMAHAARSINGPPDYGPGVVTIEMKTTFMRPGTGALRAVGRLMHRTATLAFCEGEILTDAGDRIAHATGTFKYLRALPTEKREVKPLQRRLDGAGSD